MSTLGASVIHLVLDEAFNYSSERDVLEIVKGQLDGLVVFDGDFAPIFCTQRALVLMKVEKDDDVTKVKLRKKRSIKTFKKVVGSLKDGETECWSGKKVDSTDVV
jgi:hypothetical protein